MPAPQRSRNKTLNASRRMFLEQLEHRRLLADLSPPAFLQWFDGSFDTIEDRTIDIFNAGYGAVWLPPPGRADSGNQSVGYDVYDRFDLGGPGNPTLYGTETGIKTIAETFDRASVDLHIDMVINHNGFADQSTPDFIEAGGYPGFLLQDPDGGNDPFGIPNSDGDFHSGFAVGDHDGRLAGLIDIDHSKDFRFVRSPVPGITPVQGDHGGNLPAGTTPRFGRLANVPDEANRRFYADQSLDPIYVFDPVTGEQNIAIHPFNLDDPTAGDPIGENATGYLMRNMQWLIQEVGVDGLRIDAAKHVEGFAFTFLDRAVYRQNPRPLLDGSTKNVFSYSEVFDGNRGVLQSYIRKDINPFDPGRVGGNRDVLDFAQYFTLRDNLTNNGFANDWRNIVYADMDTFDDGLRNGSAGVKFAQSHDDHGADLNNVAHAYVLMMPGNAVVYFNGKEFGDNRDFPKDGRGDALGGVFGDAVTTLNGIRNSHGRGDYHERWLDKETFVFERGGSAVVGLNNRVDDGFDTRTVDVNLPWGTHLVELTGNASDPTIDPFDDIPEVIQVYNDCFGCQTKVDIRIPRNSANGTQHGSGYVVYGLATPQAPAGLELTNVASTLAGSTPAGTPFENGTTRLADLNVITADSFDVKLQTVEVNLLGTIRDADADGDQAMLRIDGGTDVNGNGFVDVVTPGNVSYGFEEFVTKRSPKFGGGDGEYRQTVDATQLSEGTHFVEAVAYRHRSDGGEAVYSTFKEAIYVDRLPPDSGVLSFDPIVDGVNENRDLIIQSLDKTADNVHVFLDLPASLDDATVLGMVNGSNQAGQIDRDQFAFGQFGVTHGNHVVTVVTYEQTGSVNVQRIPGQFTQSIHGAGLGDVQFDGDFDVDDVNAFESILNSNNTQFNAAADLNGDGLVDVEDLNLLCQRMMDVGADQATLDALDALKGQNFDAIDDVFATTEDDILTVSAPGVVLNDSVGSGGSTPVTSVGTFSTTKGGQVTIAADGSFTYDASGSAVLQALDDGQSDTDSFTYTLSDGSGATDVATVTVNVSGIGGFFANPSLTVDGVEADYTTTKLFVDEIAGDVETLDIVFQPGETDVTEIQVVTNLNNRHLATADINGNSIDDGMEFNQTDSIIGTDDLHYYKAYPLSETDPNTYVASVPASKTGAYRLTARWKVGDDPNWRWYTAFGRRDHAITVSPVESRDIRLYELNPLTIEATGPSFVQRSTFEDLHDAPNADRTSDGIGFNLQHLDDLGANWLWLQPIHPNGIDGRQIDPGNGQPYDPGSPYAVKNFWEVNPIFSVGNTRPAAMTAFQDFVSAADTTDIGVMLDAPFNHTAFDVELGQVGVDLFANGASPTDLIRDHEGRFFASARDYGLPADVLGFGQGDIAVAPDRGDFGKFEDTKEVYFGQYSSLVRTNPGDNGNHTNEGDVFEYSPANGFTTVTQNTWKYFAEYLQYWLTQTGYPANPTGDAIDTSAGIDGLRADFAQGLPPQAWEYILNSTRARKWNFVTMAESLDGGAVTYRSNRHFDVLNENIVFALQSATTANDYRTIFEDRSNIYGEGVVLLNSSSHDEQNYVDPFEALIRYTATSTQPGVPMVFMGQELGISETFGFDEYETNFGKQIPHFKRWNSLSPVRDPANRNFAIDQIDDVYTAVATARQQSPALRSSNRYFLNTTAGSTNDDILAVAKYEQAGVFAASQDVVFAFANLDRNNAASATYDVDINTATGDNLFGIQPDHLYNVVNIAAYLGQDGTRNSQQLWPANRTGQEILNDGIFVGLNPVPTQNLGPNGWDQAPFEAQYLKLIDVSQPVVVDRNIFYNGSAFDDPASGLTDENAIPTQKSVLLPGQTATAANYTSYSAGINGIMVDVVNLPDVSAVTAADFTFKVGNSDDVSTWTAAAAPESVFAQEGVGQNGADRITITWADDDIAGTWLEVTVNATAQTGLLTPDVFYVGNAPAETLDSANNAFVTSFDFAGARDNQHSATNPALIDNRYDFDRDGLVNATDMMIARDNVTNLVTALKLISVPAAAPPILLAPIIVAPIAEVADSQADQHTSEAEQVTFADHVDARMIAEADSTASNQVSRRNDSMRDDSQNAVDTILANERLLDQLFAIDALSADAS